MKKNQIDEWIFIIVFGLCTAFSAFLSYNILIGFRNLAGNLLKNHQGEGKRSFFVWVMERITESRFNTINGNPADIFTSLVMPLLLAILITCFISVALNLFIIKKESFGRCVRDSIVLIDIFTGVWAVTILASKTGIRDSRTFLLFTIILDWILFSIVFYYIQKYVVTHFYKTASATLVVVVATSDRAEQTIAGLKKDWTRKIKGIILLDGNTMVKELEDVPVVADAKSAVSWIRESAADEVFISANESFESEVQNMIDEFVEMGIKVDCSLPCVEKFDVRMENLNVNGYHPKLEKKLLYFQNTPIISVEPPKKRFWFLRHTLLKRLMDILGGLILLVAYGICYLIFAKKIKQDGGPVLFKQTRVGKNGRRFTMYKFRSMRVGADKEWVSMKSDMKGAMKHIKEDSKDDRITPCGHILRKYKIDELPQAINVLKGDMSLVGTRPPLESEVREYSSYYKRRLMIKPGMTGMWQASDQDDFDDFEQVLQYDLQYIDNWSLHLDIYLCLLTIGKIFKKKRKNS